MSEEELSQITPLIIAGEVDKIVSKNNPRKNLRNRFRRKFQDKFQGQLAETRDS